MLPQLVHLAASLFTGCWIKDHTTRAHDMRLPGLGRLRTLLYCTVTAKSLGRYVQLFQERDVQLFRERDVRLLQERGVQLFQEMCSFIMFQRVKRRAVSVSCCSECVWDVITPG